MVLKPSLMKYKILRLMKFFSGTHFVVIVVMDYKDTNVYFLYLKIRTFINNRAKVFKEFFCLLSWLHSIPKNRFIIARKWDLEYWSYIYLSDIFRPLEKEGLQFPFNSYTYKLYNYPVACTFGTTKFDWIMATCPQITFSKGI